MIFKSSSGKSHSINVNVKTLQLIVFGIVMAFATLGAGIYLSYNTNIQKVAYNQLKKEYSKQATELKQISDDLNYMQFNLNKLIEKEEELELILGKAIVKKKS